MMESRIASNCPPMTLKEREALDAIQLEFVILPFPSIFQVSATQVLTEESLKVFVNHLLSTINHNDLTEIPKVDYWGLQGSEDGLLDLNGWDPRHQRQDIYRVIALPVPNGPGSLNPISTQWAVLGGGSWPPRVKSIQLPSQEVFEIRGPHLLLAIHWRVRVKVSNKRTKITETINDVLVPTNMKVVDLIEAFKLGGNVSGFTEISEALRNIQRTDTRTITELGWKHGTELRLEIL